MEDRSGGVAQGAVTLVAGAPALLVLLLLASAVRADALIGEMRTLLPNKVNDALGQMHGEGRRLLAMRSYLRSIRSLDERWSWTDAEIEKYAGTESHERAMAAVDSVIATFEKQNPGYSLYVNTHVRSLDEQIDKWNSNATVETGANELGTAFAEWRSEHEDASAGDASAFLSGWKPSSPVSLAAPGLSRHGQGHAFDFQIMQNGAIIVGASTRIIETVWEEEGWTGKLKLAVLASDAPFSGPLQKPNEPWHYEYDPADD